MAYETLFDASNATPVKFEKQGDSVEGYFMGSADHTGDYGPTKKHIFKTEQGAVVIFGQRNLMQQLPTAKVGWKTLITYTGDKPSAKKGFHAMKLFVIKQDPKDTIEVAGVDLTPTENTENYAPNVDNNYEADESDVDLPEVEAAPLPRAVAPRVPAKAPDNATKLKMQELLNKHRAPAKV